MADQVNAATAKAATETNKLPLGELQLLGIVTRQGAGEALLRRPDGGTFWAKEGSSTPFGKVVALDAETLILDTGAGKRRLSL